VVSGMPRRTVPRALQRDSRRPILEPIQQIVDAVRRALEINAPEWRCEHCPIAASVMNGGGR